MSDNLELSASITTEEPEVAATLSDLRYLVFEGMKGEKGDAGALAELDASYNDETKTLKIGTKSAGLAIDDRLSKTSANPVQNRVVAAALDGKQNTLTAGHNITIEGNTISADVDSEEIATNVSDWLDENVNPSGSAVVVDSSLSVSGAAADAKATGDKIGEIKSAYNSVKSISNAGGTYLFEFAEGTVNDPLSDNVVPNQSRIVTKEPVYFDNEFVKIEVADGFKCRVIYHNAVGETVSRAQIENFTYFYGGKNIPVRFEVGKINDDPIGVAFAFALKVTRVNCEERKEIGGGVYAHDTNFSKNTGINGDALVFYSPAATAVSRPIKIPKSGLRIGYTSKCHSATYMNGVNFSYPLISVAAVKAADNGLELQTENDGLRAVSESLTRLGYGAYIPYIPDCYVIVRITDRGNDLDSFLYVTSGEVKSSFCGVYNIFPTALQVTANMIGFEGQNSLDIEGAESIGYINSSAMYFATVVRLQDVDKIVCAPKYTLLAEIFKANNDGTISRHSDVWGAWYGTEGRQTVSQLNTYGLSEIDFSQYDFDGFALVAIQAPIVYARAGSSWGIKRITTGNLGGYEDVVNSVYVQYKNGVRISEVSGMPSVLKENIHKLCNWRVPEYPSGFYVEQGQTTPYYFPTQYNCFPSLYAGTFIANAILLHVTAKSALTCLQNRNGRMRKMQRVEGETKGDIAYGLTCTNLVSLIHGLKENYSSTSFAHQEKTKFDTEQFNYKTDLYKLRPGDVLTKNNERPNAEFGRPADNHCMTVASIVEMNGVIKAVNVIEASIPYCRMKTYIDETYYVDDQNWIANMYSIDGLEDYKWRSRIKPEYLRPIEKVFDLWPDNTDVGTVMCDRGTNSIYGIHTQYVELSVSDGAANSLRLYKNGTMISEISLSGAENVNGLRLINVVSSIDGEGLYTVKTDRSEDVQETFFVKGDVEAMTRVDGVETTTLTVPNMSDFVFLELWYSIPQNPNETEEETAHRMATRRNFSYPVEDFVVDDETDTGTVNVPRYLHNSEGEMEEITAAYRVYDTDYGTYWVGINGFVSSDYYGLD